jgi:outer membrane protein assembly factor BamB
MPLLMPAGAAATGAAALAVWMTAPPGRDFQPRVPVEHVPIAGPVLVQDEGPRNTGTTVPGPGSASALPVSWTQFRGADRTNVVHDAPHLARSWPADGPRLLWQIEAEEGHSGAAVRAGRVYMMDYDKPREEDVVLCLSLDDGREIWRHTYYVKVKRQHGMSRTVPAVNGEYVVTMGPKCHVVCLGAADGRLIWKKDLVEEHGASVPEWYTGQCPLIDGTAAIIAPGGDPLMMAVDLASGETLWQTPNPGGWKMTHSSIVALDFRGRRQYVYCTTRGVIGVSAQDGRILWQRDDWFVKPANMPTPLVVGEDRILLCGNYKGNGSMMIRLRSDSETEVLWRLKSKEFGSDQQTPILYEDHVYGTIPPKGAMVCLDLDGNRLWTSGAASTFGLGPYLLADGLLLALADQRGSLEEGTLHMVEATPTGYNELATAKVLEGHDAWAPMALVGDRLILRDARRVICLQMPLEEAR